MSFNFSRGSSLTKVIIIIEFLLVAYLVYSLAKNVFNSYQVDNLIEVFESENAAYESENRQKSDDFLYFTSEEYIDKIAKQNLGLVNRGEEVIVLAPETLNHKSQANDDATDFAVSDDISNSEKWIDLFFGR